MAGKRSRKNEDSSIINPALVPSAAFTVVPRTPAPDPVPVTGLGASREVLNSSLLGRPDPDDPLSDPESSLYDYQVMEEAGYSSVEMLAVARQRKASSPKSREHDVDEHQAEIHPGPLYSMPLKRERAVSTQSMHTTQDVREAMRKVHDLPSDDEGSPRRRPSARSLHFPVEHGTAVKARKSPAGSARTPQGQRAVSEEIIAQHILSPEYAENMQQEPILSARSRRSNQEPVSSRSQDASIRSAQRPGDVSARSLSAAEERVRTLEAEKEHLVSITSQLESEVQTYREVVSTYESGENSAAQSLLTQKQVTDLKTENESLKNSIQRLHTELSAYQAKYRPLREEDKADMMGLPSEGPIPSWLPTSEGLSDHPVIQELNIRYLNPLFLAYDDRLRERDETIRKCKSDLESLHQRTQDVVQENEKLHTRLEQAGSGPIDNTEWAQLRENARLVLEENQNLLEQINVKDQKAEDLHQVHVREVTKLTKQQVLLKTEKNELEQEVAELRQSLHDYKQKYEKLLIEKTSSISQEQHIKEIADLKQKHIDQEEVERKEMEALNNKLIASQMERKSLSSQLVDVQAENRRYLAEIKVMHKSVRKAQQKMMLLQKAIETSENKEMSVQEYMASLIKVAEKNAFERDTYEKVAKEHEMEIRRAMKKLLQGNITVGKMEEKLKLYKMRAAARIGTVAERLKEQEELFNSQKQEYLREINHLRMVIKEKEEELQTSFAEKREVEDQLEAVWQSANSENVRIREEVNKNVQKLRKHKGLSEAMDEHDNIEHGYLSRDCANEQDDT